MNQSILDIGAINEPLLVFGGPYSNLAATLAMRAEAERLEIPPQRIICTGDLAAYCADPQQTVDLIRNWGIHVIQGNCEQSLASGALDCGCGFDEGSVCSTLSVEWYNYAAQRIDAATRRWFDSLPSRLQLSFHGRRLLAVHATPTSNNRFIFASTNQNEKRQELEPIRADGLIAGHCGIPFSERLASKVWLNAGVIGMPANDGSADGWYMTLTGNTGDCLAQWHRLRYPAEQTAAEMRAAGLECGYAETISTGLWPSEDVLPAPEKLQRGRPLQPKQIFF